MSDSRATKWNTATFSVQLLLNSDCGCRTVDAAAPPQLRSQLQSEELPYFGLSLSVEDERGQKSDKYQMIAKHRSR